MIKKGSNSLFFFFPKEFYVFSKISKKKRKKNFKKIKKKRRGDFFFWGFGVLLLFFLEVWYCMVLYGIQNFFFFYTFQKEKYKFESLKENFELMREFGMNECIKVILKDIKKKKKKKNFFLFI